MRVPARPSRPTRRTTRQRAAQDNAVDGEPGKDQKKLAPDGQSQYPNQPRILSKKILDMRLLKPSSIC